MKNNLIVFLTILFSLTLASGALAADRYGETGEGRPTVAGHQNQQVIGTGCLVGRDVLGPSNNVLGKIRDLVIDLDTGRVEYVVISPGGFFGFGHRYPVPWQALRMQTPGGQFTLNLTEKQLRNAPRGENLANREEARRIFEFYGVSPYWQGRSCQ
jgi:hypothetical protein